MSDVGRISQRHSRVMLLAHVVWSTAGRRPMLELGVDEWLEELLRRQAHEAGCVAAGCGMALDHVHVILRFGSTVRLAEVVQRLKGGSSHAWNAARRSPRLAWQTGYWAESVSPEELGAALAYVDEQRRHHAELTCPEPWERGEDANLLKAT